MYCKTVNNPPSDVSDENTQKPCVIAQTESIPSERYTTGEIEYIPRFTDSERVSQRHAPKCFAEIRCRLHRSEMASMQIQSHHIAVATHAFGLGYLRQMLMPV